MLIAQISDCHVGGPGQKLFGKIDAGACLRCAVQVLNALPVRPDLVLATGDLTDGGGRGEYQAVLEIMGDLPCPVLPLAGNHDNRDCLIEVFGLQSWAGLMPGFVQYLWETPELRIVALDTTMPGQMNGAFCAERMDWLSAQLSRDNKPVMIAMHHPPFAVGIGWLDTSLEWAQALSCVIARHPAVIRLVCGHAHRAMITGWAGTCAMVCPSTAHQVFPDIRREAPRQFTQEAPGILLHQLSSGAMRSYSVSTAGALEYL